MTLLRFAWLLVPLAFLVQCVFDPQPPDGQQLCGNGATSCPSGYVCLDDSEGVGRCYSSEGESQPGETDTEVCDLEADLELEPIPGPNTGTVTLTSDRIWLLNQLTYVNNGATLTIEPCTRIVGSGKSAVLVVTRGGKINAVGEPDAPIVFTSDLTTRKAGDWGGLVILGRAPNFLVDGATIDETDPELAGEAIEGLSDEDARHYYGGTDPDDSSGTLQYVRIEYSGIDLGGGKEINGLTMGSVGSGTVIDHVMVNSTLDDCFEWFGGNVNVSYLICNSGGDDMFDADQGYQGTLRYLLGRHTSPKSSDPNGFEMDSDKESDARPRTTVTIDHATLCGIQPANTSFGMVLRENLRGVMNDIVLSGFDYGIDTRDSFGSLDDPHVRLTGTRIFEPFVSAFEDEVDMPELEDNPNDDEGFDEQTWFEDGTGNDVYDAPTFDLNNCLDPSGPTRAVQGSRIGAFSEGAEWNITGKWTSWVTSD